MGKIDTFHWCYIDSKKWTTSSDNKRNVTKQPISSLPLHLAAPLWVLRAPTAFFGAYTSGLRHGTGRPTNESQPPCRSGEPYAPTRHTTTKLPKNQIGDLIATSNRDQQPNCRPHRHLKQRRWRTPVESCNRTQDTGLRWKLIGTMTGKKPWIPPIFWFYKN